MSSKEERESRKEMQRLNAQLGQHTGNTRTILYAIAAVIIVGGIGWAALKQSGPPSPLLADPTKVQENDWKRGAIVPQATLIEYSDLQCPACKAYQPVIKQLLETYPTQLGLVYRHYPLTTVHQNAMAAATAAEAAGVQNKFFEMSDILFDRQSEWAELPNPQSKFESYGQELHLNIDQWKSSLSSRDIRNKINEQRKSGDKLGIQGTPTFLLNGNKIENPNSFEEFKQLITNQLANAPKPQPDAEKKDEHPFHGHANFLVLINGKAIDFSKPQHQSAEGKELNENIHLHNGHGAVAHMHKEDVTWQTFFQSLGMELTDTCFNESATIKHCTGKGQTISVILNGTALQQWENLPMHDLDRLLISVGTESAAQRLEEFKKVSDDACIYSEKCPERGKPAEKEPCVGGLGTKCD